MTVTLTQLDTLLTAIKADPQDDLARAAYADCLEEQGDTLRAEFVRVQLELNHMEEWAKTQFLVLPESRNGQWIDYLRKRERELLSMVAVPWVPDWNVVFLHPDGFELLSASGLRHPAVLFRRGFAAVTHAKMVDWLECGPDLVRRHPVEKVVLTDRKPDRGIVSGSLCWVEHAIGAPYNFPHRIFHKFFVRLKGGSIRNPATNRKFGHVRWYTDSEDPNADLSQAALAWAQEEAAKEGGV